MSSKAGFVAIIGKPNAGKSTLLNRLLNFKLSIVSPRPQTTRHKVMGILNGEGYQICLLDTPGLIDKPKDDLQKALVTSAKIAARKDADVIVLLVEPEPPPEADLPTLGSLRAPGTPLLVAVNKADVAAPEKVAAAAEAYKAALSPDAVLTLSALTGKGVADLLKEIVARMPESPPFYEGDQLSDRWERFFVSEIIREKIFDQYEEEVPHACAVVIDEFVESAGRKDEIRATVYVEKEGQKGILIGKAGRKIKDLSISSRAAVEKFLGRQVMLELRIAVRANWRKSHDALKDLGYLP